MNLRRMVPVAVLGSVLALAGVASAATLPVQTKPDLGMEFSLDGAVDQVAHRPGHNVKPTQKARSGQKARSSQKARPSQKARSQQARPSVKARTSQRVARWDRRNHGPRYRSKRSGYNHYYGGYWYRTPWWMTVVVPVLPIYGGGGDAHVQWCLNKYRSYNPQTDQFLGYDGIYHYCNSPYR